MPAPCSPDPTHRCVLTRVVTEVEIEMLRARLFELKCRDVTFLVDGDEGNVWSCTVGTETYQATITVNRWNPTNAPVIQISGLTTDVVAQVISLIWPGELDVETLLQHGSAVGDNGTVDQ